MDKKFYFSIIDDTDDAILENIKPIYNFLYQKGFCITKTIWVYPPRDKYSSGDSLQRHDYLNFIKDLITKGYEIGLHHVGSGDFKRAEIVKGLEEFNEKIGNYPKIHINHSYNPDSIYGGYKRFNWPFSWIVRNMYSQYASTFQGEVDGSDYFWGDKHKDFIRFSRNHEFNGLNTTKYDKYMPYIDPKRSKYANYWFSVTFAPTPWIFNYIVKKKAVQQLEKENGICIIYTHLANFIRDGVIEPGFVERIKWLADNPNGKYIPVSHVLDEIALHRKEKGKESYPKISTLAKFRMEIYHLLTRLKYRKLIKLDDYAFNNLNKKMFLHDKNR